MTTTKPYRPRPGTVPYRIMSLLESDQAAAWTVDEIASALGIPARTVSFRLAGLKKRGAVKFTPATWWLP